MNDDLISRQAANDALDRLCNNICPYSKKQRYTMCGACTLGGAFDALTEVPSAQKTGHWIMKEKVRGGLIGDSDYRYECSECGF